MCTNYFGAATHHKRRFQFRLVNRVFRVLPGSMGKSLVIAVRSSTERNNKTHSCTWVKRIYVWRLLSSCSARLASTRPRAEKLTRIGLYKISVCSFGECALIDTMLGIVSVSAPSLSFTRYCFPLVVCARVDRPFILPARLYCPHCCNTIVRLLGNIRPLLDLPLVCVTQYSIGNNNIV